MTWILIYIFVIIVSAAVRGIWHRRYSYMQRNDEWVLTVVLWPISYQILFLIYGAFGVFYVAAESTACISEFFRTVGKSRQPTKGK